MENTLSHIHIFKTNIDKENLHEIKNVFKNELIAEWTVDIEDCDRVLRVVSHDLTKAEIMSLVCWHGFECAELA